MKILLILLSLITCPILSQLKDNEISLQINSKNISNIYSCPTHIKYMILRWVFANKELFDSLLKHPDLLNVKLQKDAHNLMIRDKGLENLSTGSNCIIKIPDMPYIIKISGQYHRVANICSKYGFHFYIRKPNEIQLTDMQRCEELFHTQTFQTCSSYAYYLKIRDLINKNNFKNIFVPDTYLIKINENLDADDSNCLLVQRFIHNKIFLIYERLELLEKVSTQSLCDLAYLILKAGLWDIEKNLFVFEDGKLILLDLEQPNISNPEDFFHINRKVFEWNASVGIESLLKLFPENLNLKKDIKDYIEKNKLVEEFSYYKEKVLKSFD